jgi:hypothetical protein
MAGELDKTALLERLKPVEPEKDRKGAESHLRKISLASALLFLAEIDHPRELELCRAVAEHFLGSVPEPEEIDIED